jgi:hypothetical protein
LQDPDRIAERISNAHVRAIEVLSGLLREIGDTALAKRLVEAASIVGDEHKATQGSLGDELPQLGGGGLVMQRRPRLPSEISVPGSPDTRIVSQR